VGGGWRVEKEEGRVERVELRELGGGASYRTAGA
jgi:hypothetical protein